MAMVQSELWRHLTQIRKLQIILVLALMILSSLGEVVSIGLVLPFLAALTSPEKLFDIQTLKIVWVLLGLTEPVQIIWPLTLLFCFGALVAGGLRVLLLWANTRLSYAIGADFSIDIYRKTLYQPYAVHLQRNSSEVVNGILTKTGIVIYVISATLTLISSSVILIVIASVIIALDPLIAIIVFSIFSSIYLTVVLLSRRRLNADGELVSKLSTHLVKSMQEGLGGIRDILIDGSQEVYCNSYKTVDQSLRRAQGNTVIVGHCPRYLVEALGMLLIAMIAYFLSKQSGGLLQAIPMLGAIALGAQRLLPVLQQAYSSWTGIQGSKASARDVIQLLNQSYEIQRPEVKPLSFESEIKFCNVSFRYSPDEPWVLRDINLIVKKGSRIGIVGQTGSGKSTLIDILMGLLLPTEGYLEVDGKKLSADNCQAWQKNISHVPQSIFLADSTVAENIAFGVPLENIDKLQVSKVSKKVILDELIESLPEKFDTVIGERGSRLSGGQQQRIGLARALYKNSNVMILDEATSALDTKTEREIMESIYGLSDQLTILVIAHRIQTLSGCDYCLRIRNRAVQSISNYDS